jgi:hypothetical protein
MASARRWSNFDTWSIASELTYVSDDIAPTYQTTVVPDQSKLRVSAHCDVADTLSDPDVTLTFLSGDTVSGAPSYEAYILRFFLGELPGFDHPSQALDILLIRLLHLQRYFVESLSDQHFAVGEAEMFSGSPREADDVILLCVCHLCRCDETQLYFT